MLPGADYGVGVALGVRARSIRVEVSFNDWLRRVEATIPGGTAGGAFRLLSGTLYACNAFGTGWIEVGPCAELDVGRIGATGLGATSVWGTGALWLAAGAGAAVEAKLDARGNWLVPLHLDVLVPLERRDFVIQNVPGVVYHPTYVAGRAALALAYRFW